MLPSPPSWQGPLSPAQAEEISRLMATPAGFQHRYRDDPARFVLECFRWDAGEAPTPYQLEILRALVQHRRVAARGPHGLGKTAMAAWAVLWFALTRDGRDWKIVTTAGAWRQLSKFLWPEIRKWGRRLRWAKIPRTPFDFRRDLMDLSLKLATGEAFAAASDQPALIEGAHAKHLLYLFDEAKSIGDATWDAAEGAFSGRDEALALALSTPGVTGGRFYEIHARRPGFEDWWVRAVTLPEAIQAGRVSQAWVDQRRKQWGEGTAVFQNRVLGEFATGNADGLIPLAWVEAAIERWRAWDEGGRVGPDGKPFEMDGLGVDVADQGGDETVMAPKYGKVIGELMRWRGQDTMATTGQIVTILRGSPQVLVTIDCIGIGAGVVSRLREQDYMIEAFNAAERSDMLDRSGELAFANRRSAGWWTLRELLDPANQEGICLPPDDLLIGDLTAPAWRLNSSGKVLIESKDDIRKRIGRSTDSGDALVHAFFGAAQNVTPGISFIG